MIFSKKYLYYILSLVLFIFISYFFIDKTVARYFLEHKKNYEALGDFISIFGESHWYFATAIIGLIIFKYYRKNGLFAQRFLFLLYINLFSGAISIVTKFIFGRIRPWGLRDDGDSYGFLLFQNFDMGFIEKMKYHFITVSDAPTTYTSFPSGHTTTIFAVFAYLCILFPKYSYLWFSIAIVLACGRILDSDHFISDIFAGIIVGTLSTLFIYSKMKEKIEKKY
ncbi:MAG: phosphatase PAP2 family protein [Sulfurimonas sp.]|jgi:membrane-associated phospholipid phosphatase